MSEVKAVIIYDDKVINKIVVELDEDGIPTFSPDEGELVLTDNNIDIGTPARLLDSGEWVFGRFARKPPEPLAWEDLDVRGVRIVFSKSRLEKGEACWMIDGEDEPWDGFNVDGRISVRAEGGRAWIEYHGDKKDIRQGGTIITPDPDSLTLAKIDWNFIPSPAFEKLKENSDLWYGAVNKFNVIDQTPMAVTCYNLNARTITNAVTFEGKVSSVTVNPPMLEMPQPLNAWIQCEGGHPYFGLQ